MTVILKNGRHFQKWPFFSNMTVIWPNYFSRNCSLLIVGLQDPIKVSVLFDYMRSWIETKDRRTAGPGPFCPQIEKVRCFKTLIKNWFTIVHWLFLAKHVPNLEKFDEDLFPDMPIFLWFSGVGYIKIFKKIDFEILNFYHVICNI